MSTNFHILGKRNIYIPKVDKHEVQKIYFDCYQTPSTVTYELMDTEDPIAAYKTWLSNKAKDYEYEEPIYANNDFLTPIGYQTKNEATEHLLNLDRFIENAKNDGYDIEYEAW